MISSSPRSSDGKLKPSSDNLVTSPTEDEGKGSGQGIKRKGERENAMQDEKDPLNDSRPREDMMTAEQDNDALT